MLAIPVLSVVGVVIAIAAAARIATDRDFSNGIRALFWLLLLAMPVLPLVAYLLFKSSCEPTATSNCEGDGVTLAVVCAIAALAAATTLIAVAIALRHHRTKNEHE